MTLNNKQKRVLFSEGYVTAKILDSLTYPDWQDYWIKRFTWTLYKTPTWCGMLQIKLVEKPRYVNDFFGASEYCINVNPNIIKIL